VSAERALLAGVATALSAAGKLAQLREGPRTLLAALGWDLPPGVDDIGLASLSIGRVGERLAAWNELASDPTTSSDEDVAVALAELAVAVGDALLDLSRVRLEAPQDYLDRTGIVDDFLRRLLDLYLVQAAAVASRPIFDVAALLGLVELRREPADPARFQVAHLRHIVHWNRLPTLVTDPGSLLRDVYGWGTAAFDSTALVTQLGAVLLHISTGVRRRTLPPIPLFRLHGGTPPPHPPQPQLFLPLLGSDGALSSEVGITVFGLPPTTAGGNDGGLGLAPYARGTAELRIPLSSQLSIGMAAGADLGSGLALVLRPGVDPTLRTGLNEETTGSGDPGARVAVDLTLAVPDGGERVSLLAADGVSVTARSLALAVTISVDADGTDAILRLSVAGGQFALTSAGLPFLDSVLPAGGLVADVDVDLSWSHRGGVRLGRRAELRTSRAVSFRVGPLTIDALELALGSAAGGLSLTASVSVTLALGPVLVSVAGLGVRAAVVPGPGSLGSADLTVRPSRPTGIGIAVDAGIVAGGGFLFIDPDGHTYAGVLDLKIGAVAIKALGLFDTRSAAAPGWSLLLLLFAKFPEPVPIGFGFSLSAVGGILGLNFGVGVDPLRASLGTGAFDDVLFPADPVGNAPRIIGRLRTFFPATPGALVVGPAVEIVWGGAVPLVTARLAVLAQIAHVTDASPARFDRLVAIGTVRAAAPAGNLDVPPTIRLIADLFGLYDAQSGLLAIDAQLRDSVIAGVAVAGTVIVRVGLGSLPAFALSAGGFHPDFTDLPPQLPARVDRVSLTWSAGGNASVSMQLRAYVALTAATLQLGASFQLTARVGPVSLNGQLGFDLLINKDLSFSAHVVGRVSIRFRGRNLAGIGLDMVLSRSSEQVWRVRGTATFEILWWDVDVDFDDSWGQPARLPGATIRVADEVRAALADPANWTPALPEGGEHLVNLTSPRGGAAVLAHPLGRLRIAQQVAPLDLELDHVDNARIDGARRIAVNTVRIGAGASTPKLARDPFTRARYQQLDEAQRLRSKSFESLPSGVLIGDAGFVAPAGIGVGAGHETRLIGPLDAPPPPPPPPLRLPGQWLGWQLQASAAAGSPVRTREAMRPAVPISLEPQAVPFAAVHPGTLRTEPLDAEAVRSPALAEQAAAAAGLRVLELYEALM